jgi:hypothetical protein
MNPARAAAPGEGRSDVPETGSAGAQEAARDFAGRVRRVSARHGGVEGSVLPATTESRKAGNVSAPTPLANTLASVGFIDEKPWV